MSDYSCYVTIDNTNNKYPLNLNNSSPDTGYWDPGPPQTILAGECISFRIHDPSGPNGSQGSCSYTPTTGSSEVLDIGIGFADPYSGSNNFDVTLLGANASLFSIEWMGLAGNNVTGNNPGNWDGAMQSGVSSDGHPVSCLVTVKSL